MGKIRIGRFTFRPRAAAGGGGGGTFAGAVYNVASTGWIYAAHWFPQAAVAAGQGIVLGSFSTQNSIFRTWPDGSARGVIFIAKATSTGNHTLQLGTAATGTITPTAPSISVDVTAEGLPLRTATFTDTGYSNTWVSGPNCKETKQSVQFTSATGALAHVWVHIYLRSYNDGSHQISIVLDNSVNASTAAAIPCTIVMKVGGATVYTKTLTVTTGSGTLAYDGSLSQVCSVAHGLAANDFFRITSGARNGVIGKVWKPNTGDTTRFGWIPGPPLDQSGTDTWQKLTSVLAWGVKPIKRFTSGSFVEATYTPALETFYKSGTLYRPAAELTAQDYSHTTTIQYPNDSDFNVKPFTNTDFEFLNTGIFFAYVHLGGLRPELGFQPEWVQLYCRLLTQASRTFLFEMADLSGGLSKHMTNSSDGSVCTLADQPTFHNPANLEIGAATGTIFPMDPVYGSAHLPDCHTAAFVLTGDRYHLDGMVNDAAWSMFSQLTLRGDGNGVLIDGVDGVRSSTWALRNLISCLAFAPDSDAHRTNWTTILGNNNTQMGTNIAAEQGTLGTSLFITSNVTTNYTGQPYWANFAQQTFMISYVSHTADYARRTGVSLSNLSAYASRIATFYINAKNDRAADQPEQVYSYFMNLADSSGNIITSYANVWTFNKGVNASFRWLTVPKVYGNFGYAPQTRMIYAAGINLGVSGAQAAYDALEAKRDDGLHYKTYDWTNVGLFTYGWRNTALEMLGDA